MGQRTGLNGTVRLVSDPVVSGETPARTELPGIAGGGEGWGVGWGMGGEGVGMVLYLTLRSRYQIDSAFRLVAV